MKKTISSDKAPKAVGPYSQAILHDNGHVMELSGQIGFEPATGKLAEGGVAAQTRQAMENIHAVLAAAGMDFSHVVKARVYLADMGDYATMNEVYSSYFPAEPPARVALAVRQLPLGALVEIECTAASEVLK